MPLTWTVRDRAEEWLERGGLCDSCDVAKRSVAWLSLAAVVLIGVLLYVQRASGHRRDDATVPAWASHCFPRPISVSSSDVAYLGLTRKAAVALAAARGEHLVAFGADQQCLTRAGVAQTKPVAIAFDAGADGGIPASAKVIFASSDGGVALNGG